MTGSLSTWKDGAAKDAILEFVSRVCTEGSPDWMPVEDRGAVFDNDGTLWCEKPMPIQLDFILRRLTAMAEGTPPCATGRDFMRPISQEVYGIPREGVIGSAVAFAYTPGEHGGSITRQMAADYLDDGPEKLVHIWTRTGRRPVLAAGNSNGDIEMLHFTQRPDKPSLRLLVLHDDADREFDYVSGAEKALQLATEHGWTVVSVKDDWATVL